MPFERTLWERLAQAGSGSERNLRVRTDQVVDSVLTHLRKMFNVRQGNVPAFPTYGMPDFNDIAHQFPNAIVEVQRAIRSFIEAYEPRLQNVRVRYEEDQENVLDLRFEIQAELVADGRKTPIRFKTELDTLGRMSVKR